MEGPEVVYSPADGPIDAGPTCSVAAEPGLAEPDCVRPAPVRLVQCPSRRRACGSGTACRWWPRPYLCYESGTAPAITPGRYRPALLAVCDLARLYGQPHGDRRARPRAGLDHTGRRGRGPALLRRGAGHARGTEAGHAGRPGRRLVRVRRPAAPLRRGGPGGPEPPAPGPAHGRPGGAARPPDRGGLPHPDRRRAARLPPLLHGGPVREPP